MTARPDVKVMRLRYAGVCACGTALGQGERAAYDRAAKRVLCLRCHDLAQDTEPRALDGVATGVPSPAPEVAIDHVSLDVGVAGAGALREYQRRKSKDDAARAERSRIWRALNSFFYPDGRQTTNAWKIGAAGEERVAQTLTARVDAGSGYALHDRTVPGKRSNIDHIFVGAAGVFVIDAKRYKNAEVTVERSGGLFGPVVESLRVTGRRKPALIEAVRKQCDVVQVALTASGHTDIPVIPTLCFVDASLPFREKNRRVNGVRLSGPKGLGSLVATPGPLDDEQRFAVAMALSNALPSMG